MNQSTMEAYAEVDTVLSLMDKIFGRNTYKIKRVI